MLQVSKFSKKAKRSKYTYVTLTLDDLVEYFKELAVGKIDNKNLNAYESIRN